MLGTLVRLMLMSGAAPTVVPVLMDRDRARRDRRGRLTPQLRKATSVALVWIVWLSLVSPVGAVTCVTCKDTISGCSGGTGCPLRLAGRVALR